MGLLIPVESNAVPGGHLGACPGGLGRRAMVLTHELRLGPGRLVGTDHHTSEWAEMAGLKPNTLGITKRSASLTLCVTSLSAVGAPW